MRLHGFASRRSAPVQLIRRVGAASALLVLLPLAAFAVLIGAQGPTLSIGTPRDVAMSPALLQQGVDLYRDAVERGDLVGAVLLVARHGKVVVYEAIGSRHKEAGLPMEKNTMFRMASNTKPVIATAAAILAERGKLRYDDSVWKHIPSFDNRKARAITIHQLLSHTSGFRINTLFMRPLMEKSAKHPDAPNLRLEAARFGAVGAKETPGASYSYSNPGFNTLGAIIEIASGRPLDVFLREEVYRKLGMSDTYNLETVATLEHKLHRMGAVYYNRNKEGHWVVGWKPGDPPTVPFVRASGGMVSTAWDYAIFLQMFLNGGAYGDVRLLDAATVKTMTARHTPPGPASYGYGWGIDSMGSYSHGGSDGTFAWVDPARGIIGMVLTQTPNGRNPRRQFVDLVNLAAAENSGAQ